MSVDRPDSIPQYHHLSEDVFEHRVTDLRKRYADCDLCAYECHVDRTAGQEGTYQVDDTAYVSSYVPHFDEEDCLRGHKAVEQFSWRIAT